MGESVSYQQLATTKLTTGQPLLLVLRTVSDPFLGMVGAQTAQVPSPHVEVDAFELGLFSCVVSSQRKRE